jgi:hypothetical protein
MANGAMLPGTALTRIVTTESDGQHQVTFDAMVVLDGRFQRNSTRQL